jgi:hypothetical protein
VALTFSGLGSSYATFLAIRSRKGFRISPNLASKVPMMKQTLVLLFVFMVAGCSRNPHGAYRSFGSEDKFLMTLDVVEGGQARFTTRSNVGDPNVDRVVESSMTVDNARWIKDGEILLVTGTAKDGKAASYRFQIQKNGDLIWDKNGARLVKAR